MCLRVSSVYHSTNRKRPRLQHVESRDAFISVWQSTNRAASWYGMLMAGIGLDASIVRHVRPRLKKRIGKGAFWISGLSHLASWSPCVQTRDRWA